MPHVIPPAGSGGLPRISTRAFQFIDRGYSVWEAVYYALIDWMNAVVVDFGNELVADIGEIGL